MATKNSEVEDSIRNELFAMQDMKYRNFHCKLIPTVNPELVIGIRTPILRKYAKNLSKTSQAEEFLQIFPHKYYEENNLHGFLIELLKDYGQAIQALDTFLPYVDNWATCDSVSPKVFEKHLPELLQKIEEWIASSHTYTVRFGVGMLMKFYLDEAFQPQYPEMVAGIVSQEYYVNMMIAWYFATALAKQYDAILPFIQEQRLDPWTHNKAIQKAIESFRITPEQKTYLKSLKRK